MKNSFYLLNFLKLIILLSCFIAKSQAPYESNKFIDKANLFTKKNLDSAVYHLNKGITFYTAEKDTVNLINSLCHLSALYDNVLDYGKSYDGYWDALLLADQSKDDISKSRIYQELGWLYTAYRKENESLHYFNKSLELKKKLIKENKINENYLVSNYFAIVNCCRVNKNLNLAKVYLDSCKLTLNRIDPSKKSYYVEAEIAYYKAVGEDDFNGSINLLTEVESHFKSTTPSYLTVIYYLFGEIYRREKQNNQSIKYYKESLKYSEMFNKHFGYKFFNYDALAHLYFDQGNFKEAFYYKDKSQKLNEQIFGRKSNNNKHLIEIKDKYRLQKEQDKALLKEAQIEKLESQKRISFLRNILLALVLIFLVLYGGLFIRNLRRKHKLEKEKTNEVMALKNRELTASALQLIEKEEFIMKLKTSISSGSDIDKKAINRMINSFHNSPGGNWEEFQARFTSINQSFYKNIKQQFPSLGKTDLKLCALIKLGFSSKEMASLLGITIDSVNTSRYRLRKKLNLTKGMNLNDFITKL